MVCEFLKVSARAHAHTSARTRMRTYYIGRTHPSIMAQNTFKAVLLSASSIPIDERTIAYLYGPRICTKALKDAEYMEDLCTKASQLLGRPHKTLDPAILSIYVSYAEFTCPDSLCYNIVRQFVWTGLWGKTTAEAESLYYSFVQEKKWYQHPDWHEARRLLADVCAVSTVVCRRGNKTVRVLAHNPLRRRERPSTAFCVPRGMEVLSAPQNSSASILVDSTAFHKTV